MPSPYLQLPRRSESQIRHARRECFIARQLSGLGQLGFSAEALAREETLLRGGAVAEAGFAALLGALDAQRE